MTLTPLASHADTCQYVHRDKGANQELVGNKLDLETTCAHENTGFKRWLQRMSPAQWMLWWEAWWWKK